MYLLDSNAWIAIFRGKSSHLIAEVKRRSQDEIAICPVVIAELWYGACRSLAPHRAGNQALIDGLRTTYFSLPFTDKAATDSAELRAELAAAGLPIGPYDLLIAAIARTHGATLVTHNTAEFARVSGLSIEDWQVS
jgi:tRNA(fMet)-specific endonuclease VapC